MKNRIKHISFNLLLLVGLSALFLPGSGTQAAAYESRQVVSQNTTDLSNFPTDQIIISYKSSSQAFMNPTGTDQMTRVTQATGVALQYYRSMSGNAHVLRLPASLPLD
jgi:hypothetical protein